LSVIYSRVSLKGKNQESRIIIHVISEQTDGTVPYITGRQAAERNLDPCQSGLLGGWSLAGRHRLQTDKTDR
jgi:hypothetical protein